MKMAVYAAWVYVCEREKDRKRRKGGGELVSIKQLDLLRALVKASGPNQNDHEGEG